MATFHLDLVAPDKLTFSGDVDQVDVPGQEGDFGVLAGHAPMVAVLRPGVLTIYANGAATKMIVLGGFVEVSPDGMTVLADFAESQQAFDRGILTTRIAEAEAKVKSLEQGSALDRAIQQLDSFRKVDEHLQGTAMH